MSCAFPRPKLSGWFQFEAFVADLLGAEIPGTRRVVAPWFPNLITENGLERMGATTQSTNYVQVGAGAATPNVNDTTLASYIAGTNQVNSTVTGAQATAPYFGWVRRTFRFPEGAAAGNLSEVGIGWSPAGNLFSRALILDPGGSPTTITVAANETLDVTYELRGYPPLEDVSGSITLEGIAYSWVARAADVTQQAYWAPPSNGPFVGLLNATAYNGAMGPITGAPSGASGTIAAVRGTYSANSRKIATQVTAALAQGNLAGGIRSILLQGGGGYMGSYQIEFTPPIPKVSTKVLSLTFETAWARHA